MPEDFPQTIATKTQVKLAISDSEIYAISITARCKGKNDLRVEIDNQLFREIPPEKNIQKFDIPPAWNGTKLKDRSQTNIFLLQLDEGEHVIDFIPEGQAKVEKLIIDNQVEKNPSSRLWRNWVWHATPKQFLSGHKREQKVITKDLSKGVHYIELWADKTPTLHNVILDLGDFQFKRIPTVYDPNWTGDFSDDKERQYDAFCNNNTKDKVRDPLNHVAQEEWQECYEVAGIVIEKKEKDPTSGATNFYSTANDTGFPWWANENTYRAKIGITYFYELKN